MLLHDAQELDDDLRAGADENLALAALLSVVDGVERIVKDGSLDHFDRLTEILKRRDAVRGICREEEQNHVSLSEAMSAKSALQVCETGRVLQLVCRKGGTVSS